MLASMSEVDSRYSQFTMAALKDTNWYASIDYNVAEDLLYGKNAGCSWVTNACSIGQSGRSAITSINTISTW